MPPESLLSRRVNEAENLVKLGKLKRAARILTWAIRAHSPLLDQLTWRQLAAVLDRLGLSKREKERIWSKTNSVNEIRMQSVLDDLLSRKNQRATKAFREIAREIFPENLQEHLVEAVEALSSDREDYAEEVEDIRRRHIARPRVVLVSGMSWSGSSAIFDFLREFNGVVAIETEIPHLSRGSFNLYEIWKRLDSDTNLRFFLMGFFFKYLLGYSRIAESHDMRIHKFARRQLLGSESLSYAQAVRECALIISAMIADSDFDNRKRLFETLVTVVLLRIVAGDQLSETGVLVLNNAIKIVNLAQSEVLGSCLCFASFRDPRDTYLAQLDESVNLGIQVDEWIERASRNYVLASAVVEDLSQSNPRCDIVKVQFEDFVLSESVRQRVREIAGLSSAHWNRNRFFKPWVSARNVGLFERLERTLEIATIESKMADFCK